MSTATVTGRHLIGGKAFASAATSFDSRSPANQAEVVGTFPLATAADAHHAVAAARTAYLAWRRTSRILRAELFDKLAQIIHREADDLARLMARECGKVVTECRAEVVEGLHMVQYVFGPGRMPTGDVLASDTPEKDA